MIIFVFELNDGYFIFQFGYGVFKVLLVEIECVVSEVFEIGYCYIDIVVIYGNEEGVGVVIVFLGILWDELFVMMKFWNDCYYGEEFCVVIGESFDKFGFEYVDLYFVYWFILVKDDYVYVFVKFVELCEVGLMCSIGVFNFFVLYLECIVKEIGVVFVVNQIELYFVYQCCEEVVWVDVNDVCIEVWGLFGQGKYDLFGILVVVDVVVVYGVILVQVVFCWYLQKGIIVFLKLVCFECLCENFDVFGFELIDVEVVVIDVFDLFDGFGCVGLYLDEVN